MTEWTVTYSMWLNYSTDNMHAYLCWKTNNMLKPSSQELCFRLCLLRQNSIKNFIESPAFKNHDMHIFDMFKTICIQVLDSEQIKH